MVAIVAVGDKNLESVKDTFPSYLGLRIEKYCDILDNNPPQIAEIISNKHLEVFGEKL